MHTAQPCMVAVIKKVTLRPPHQCLHVRACTGLDFVFRSCLAGTASCKMSDTHCRT